MTFNSQDTNAGTCSNKLKKKNLRVCCLTTYAMASSPHSDWWVPVGSTSPQNRRVTLSWWWWCMWLGRWPKAWSTLEKEYRVNCIDFFFFLAHAICSKLHNVWKPSMLHSTLYWQIIIMFHNTHALIMQSASSITVVVNTWVTADLPLHFPSKATWLFCRFFIGKGHSCHLHWLPQFLFLWWCGWYFHWHWVVSSRSQDTPVCHHQNTNHARLSIKGLLCMPNANFRTPLVSTKR